MIGALFTVFLILTIPIFGAETHAGLPPEERTVRNIYIAGATSIPIDAIEAQIPFKPNSRYVPYTSNELIKNIYGLGSFAQINVMGRSVGDSELDIYIFVEEKKKLGRMSFTGNSHLSEKEIMELIDPDDISTISAADLPSYIDILTRLYRKKDYHHVKIVPEYTETDTEAHVVFNITEGPTSKIRRVLFKGNNAISSKKLRGSIFTREQWLFGFLTRAGSLQPEALEIDKHAIEQLYQDNGYLNAKTAAAEVVEDPDCHRYTVTFTIDEGDCYTIDTVQVIVPENTPNTITEEQLLHLIAIKPGQVYSREKITKSIDTIRTYWGEFGYLFVDINPAIEPNNNNKTVSITFHTELGSPVTLNRLTIIGNNKTEDKVIRRVIPIAEGDTITNQKMDDAKLRVEGLGYFDVRSGVNWKITRLDDETADLDLLLQEIKTGHIGGQIGLGGNILDPSDPTNSVRFNGFISDTNLFGKGWQFSSTVDISKQVVGGSVSLGNPWVYDLPISLTGMIFYTRSNYAEELQNVQNGVVEKLGGGSLTAGFITNIFGGSSLLLQAGVQDMNFGNDTALPTASSILPPAERIELTDILRRRLDNAILGWFQASMGQDVRNHPIHPARGYRWGAQTKWGFSVDHSNFGFFKLDLDGSYYTPLIGERSLVLGLHGHFGLIHGFNKNKQIPYRELYHVGGPATVRGYLWGQIGPLWISSESNLFDNTPIVDSIGAQKALWNNIELIFPLTPDFNIKACVFYDGGAGWDTPDAQNINPDHLVNNNFNYRHTVGIGIRFRNPTPLRIDWGFKLDRNKRLGESESEVHFGAYHEF